MKKSDITQHAPTFEGDSVYVKHAHCSAVSGGGEDTKPRLWIKKTRKYIIAYCHHCQEQLTIRSEKSLATTGAFIPYAKQLLVEKKCMLSSELDISKLSVASDNYMISYGVDYRLCKLWEVTSTQDGDLLLPIYNSYNELQGYQKRFLNREDPSSPKYKTYLQTEDTKLNGSWYRQKDMNDPHSIDPTTLIITEDIVSAIKAATVCHGFALLGLHLSDDMIVDIIAGNYSKVFVWLDNDSPANAALPGIVKKLQLVLHKDVVVYSVRNTQEPKHHSRTYIYNTINKVLK